MRVAQTNGLRISHVQRGSAAETAGFSSGDEWLAVAVGGQTWRVMSLDEVTTWLAQSAEVQALVNRDGQIITLDLHMPVTPAAQLHTLHTVDATLLKHWLH